MFRTLKGNMDVVQCIQSPLEAQCLPHQSTLSNWQERPKLCPWARHQTFKRSHSQGCNPTFPHIQPGQAPAPPSSPRKGYSVQETKTSGPILVRGRDRHTRNLFFGDFEASPNETPRSLRGCEHFPCPLCLYLGGILESGGVFLGSNKAKSMASTVLMWAMMGKSAVFCTEMEGFSMM